MYFRQILHSDLGCASYLIADSGEGAVIDPKWEIGEYLEAAAAEGAEIRHVLETHNHADHVSGRQRLTSATGAAVHIPAGSDGTAIEDGAVIQVGQLTLAALATPGHRPEHMAYLLSEDGVPRLLFSGDSLLVGDVARPDLAVPAAEGAQDLWHTLRRLLALDDQVEVWPAHVGGSLCASRNASSATSSTIGHERATNPLLSLVDPVAFSAEVTNSMPARPPTVERVVGLNLRGAVDPGPVPVLDAEALGRFLGADACVLDIREPDSFEGDHLEGSVNLPSESGALATRAGWATGDGEAVIVASSLALGHDAVELLRAGGVWNLAGIALADPEGWRAAGLPVRSCAAISADRLARSLGSGEVTLIDVRDPAEWAAGHVAGARNLPLSELGDGTDLDGRFPTPIGVVCASGMRAAIAASILRRRGLDPVWRVDGGVDDLAGSGAPMVPEQG